MNHQFCDGKTRYENPARARAAARTIRNIHDERMHHYFCKKCLGFHLGHRMDRDRPFDESTFKLRSRMTRQEKKHARERRRRSGSVYN